MKKLIITLLLAAFPTFIFADEIIKFGDSTVSLRTSAATASIAATLVHVNNPDDIFVKIRVTPISFELADYGTIQIELVETENEDPRFPSDDVIRIISWPNTVVPEDLEIKAREGHIGKLNFFVNGLS